MSQLMQMPAYEADLFSPAALREPFGHYWAMRDLGPVVRLRDPDVYALSRFDDVLDALQAPDALSSAGGVGFSDEFNRPGAPNLLQSDGDQHRRLRSEVVRPLLPAQLKQHRPFLRKLISERIKSLVGRGAIRRHRRGRTFPAHGRHQHVGRPALRKGAHPCWTGPPRPSTRWDHGVKDRSATSRC